jgi:hypothetical protein
MALDREAAPAPDPGSAVGIDDVLGEPGWPPVAALLIFMVLNVAARIYLPNESVAHLPWLVPAIEVVLLVVLLTSNPTGAAERRRLHRIALAVVVLLVVAALWATVILIHDLIDGVGVSQNPSELLAAGAEVWLGNIFAFAMLYWLMDGGGPIARTRHPDPVDFAFTQQMSPELAPPNWRPVFLDYLHLGFTNSTAFSPTDVMPLTLRAKYTMLVQSTVALALFGLVVARAVNAFT